MNNENEIWKRAVSSLFPNLVVDLEVSNLASIRKITNNKLYKPNKKDGYYMIKRGKKNIYIHTLVAETFHGPRPDNNKHIDHIDGDKTNNREDNLRYIDSKENAIKGNSNDRQLPQNTSQEQKMNILYDKLLTIEKSLELILSNFIK